MSCMSRMTRRSKSKFEPARAKGVGSLHAAGVVRRVVAAGTVAREIWARGLTGWPATVKLEPGKGKNPTGTPQRRDRELTGASGRSREAVSGILILLTGIA